MDQVAASLEADGGRQMDRLFMVRRGHPEATTKLGTAVVNGEVSPLSLSLSMSHHCLLGW